MVPTHPLRRPFERAIRAFGKHLPRAVEGEVESLHQCRVATRRLREILPLCAAEVPQAVAARARRRLRRVGRAMGGVREVDVALGLIDELSQRGVVDAAAAERLRQHLRDERDEGRERMLDRLQAVNTRRLERDLAKVARVLSMRDQSDGWAQTLAGRMGRRARRVRQAVWATGALYVSDRVHAVRIAAKTLRYVLEVAGDTGEAPTKVRVRTIKHVQDVLGRLHDVEVLAGSINELTLPGLEPEPSRGGLEQLRPELDRECRELHSQYVARRESLLEISDFASGSAVRIWTDRGGVGLPESIAKSGARALKMGLTVQPADRNAAR